MTSLTLPTELLFFPNSCSPHPRLLVPLRRCRFRDKKSGPRILCSAVPRRSKKKKTDSDSDSDSNPEKTIDPVGFLDRLGITHKGFAYFLRERQGEESDCFTDDY